VTANRVALVFAVLLAWLGSQVGAGADTLSWSGGGGADANWSNSANWGYVGTPHSGDTLIFSASQPNLLNTNNLSGLVLNQIRFVGPSGGYDIRGNGFALTNNIEATNSAGANTIENAITLSGADQVVDVAAALTLYGQISGPVGLIKNGAGTLTLAGPTSNTYGGATMVNAGLVQLNKLGFPTAATAIPGNLIIGNGALSATVRNLANAEIADTAAVTVNLNGTWDLNSLNETIGTQLTFNNGGAVSIGTGNLTMQAPGVISANNGTATISGSGALQVGSGTCQVNVVNGELDVYASIQGSAGITKNGGGNLLLFGANTYTGQTVVSDGWLWAENSLALGASSAGTTVASGASLVVQGGVNIVNEPLTLNGPGRSGWTALDAEGTETNVWAGPITLAADSTLGNYGGGMLRIQGTIAGAGGLTELGTGTLSLEGTNANTYAGLTVVSAGTLALGKGNSACAVPNSLVLSNYTTVRLNQSYQIYHPARSLALTTTLSPGSVLDLNGYSEWLAQVSLAGARINSGAGVLFLSGDIDVLYNTVTNSAINGNLQLFTYVPVTNNTITTRGHAFSPDLEINAVISGSGTNALIKAGAGEVKLTCYTNTYAGETIVMEGGLWALGSASLGATNLPATVKNGATLGLYLNAAVGLKPLVLSGSGYAAGALAAFGTNSWAGNITLAGDSYVNVYAATNTLSLSGAVGGPGALTKNGAGALTFAGSAGNTYGGVTRVSAGTLILAKSVYEQSVPHDLVIDGTVLYLNNNQVPNLANVTVNGMLNFNGYYEGLGTITGAGAISLGDGFLDMYGSANCTFNGIISGTGPTAFTQTGAGTITLNGNNTYVGKTRVASGKLIINGQQPQSATQVDSGGTLGGSGTVGSVTANGTIAPGNSVGILTCGNLGFSATGNFVVELAGTNAGVGHDQLSVRGSVGLTNTVLTVVPAFVTPAVVGQAFIILTNDSSDPILGTFKNLPQGASLTANGYSFTIGYAGGSGNDVVLVLTNLPVAQAGYSVALGNGSGSLDPNECNYLSLSITNQSGNPMTDVAATLASATPNVAVTQPFSSYPTVPGNGTGTNIAPFQISISPNFTCGTNINLKLTLATASHGSFTIPITLASGSPGGVPLRYDVSAVTNIPDVGTIESTNVVAGYTGPLGKVSVSLWLTHPVVSDLSLSLISPDGTVVSLVAGVGSGANFGAACSPDTSRTTFDDSAPISITAGTPPFIGTFRPQGSLAVLNRTTANGAWRLRITDSVGGSLGALRCWSLLLSPVTCSAGSGICELCPNTVIMGATGLGTPYQTGRLNFNGTPSVCGVSKPCPGSLAGSFPADNYVFRNGPSNACITVTVEQDSIYVQLLAAAYLGSYDPANTDKCPHYLADAGIAVYSGNPSGTFSFNVASNATFVVNVMASGANTTPYRLTVSGGDCRPALNLTPVGTSQVKLDWTTAAPGFGLESTNRVGAGSGNWLAMTNVPVIINSRFTVTNNAPAGGQFYRLHKP
jgi:autotransporter-associated beta strand protein